MQRHTYEQLYIEPAHKNSDLYITWQGKMARRGKKYRNVIQPVTLIFSVEMHRHTCTSSYTHRVQWPSHFLRRVPFSPHLSFCLSLSQLLRRCGDKISIPFPLCFPRRLNKRWRPRGQKERRRDGGKQKERCKQRKTLRERGGKKKKPESQRQRNIELGVWQAEKEDRWEDKDKRNNVFNKVRRKKIHTHSKWTGCRLAERTGGKISPQWILILMSTPFCLLTCLVTRWIHVVDEIFTHYCSLVRSWLIRSNIF